MEFNATSKYKVVLRNFALNRLNKHDLLLTCRANFALPLDVRVMCYRNVESYSLLFAILMWPRGFGLASIDAFFMLVEFLFLPLKLYLFLSLC